jgi:hypothetical protein
MHAVQDAEDTHTHTETEEGREGEEEGQREIDALGMLEGLLLTSMLPMLLHMTVSLFTW